MSVLRFTDVGAWCFSEYPRVTLRRSFSWNTPCAYYNIGLASQKSHATYFRKSTQNALTLQYAPHWHWNVRYLLGHLLTENITFTRIYPLDFKLHNTIVCSYASILEFVLISATLAPLASNGELNLHIPNSSPVKIRIKQIQLEQVPLYLSTCRTPSWQWVQDTAKSTYNPRTLTSNIDLNRAGIGLMEIVSEPDLRFVCALFDFDSLDS